MNKKIMVFFFTLAFICIFRLESTSLANEDEALIKKIYSLASEGSVLQGYKIGTKRGEVVANWGYTNRCPFPFDDLEFSMYYPHKKIALAFKDTDIIADSTPQIGNDVIGAILSHDDIYRNLTPQKVRDAINIKPTIDWRTGPNFHEEDGECIAYDIGKNTLYFHFPSNIFDEENGLFPDPLTTPYIILINED